jgi:hypothetical protein
MLVLYQIKQCSHVFPPMRRFSCMYSMCIHLIITSHSSARGGVLGKVSSFSQKILKLLRIRSPRDQVTICHSHGLTKIGQKILGRNVNAFGTNYYKESKCHCVTNRSNFPRRFVRFLGTVAVQSIHFEL